MTFHGAGRLAALAPEVRVVRQVADGFLDLALGLFEDTHLCALSSWLVGNTGTSTRRPEERKRSSVTFRNALLPVFVVVGRSLGLLDGVGLGDLESEMGPFRRWWLANRLGLFDGVGLGDVESEVWLVDVGRVIGRLGLLEGVGVGGPVHRVHANRRRPPPVSRPS